MSLPALHLHPLRLRARGRLDPPCCKRDPDTGACRSPHNEQTPDPIKEKVRTDVEHTAGLEESEQSDQAEPDFRIHEPTDVSSATPAEAVASASGQRPSEAAASTAWPLGRQTRSEHHRRSGAQTVSDSQQFRAAPDGRPKISGYRPLLDRV
jgi:hypothetical protein